LINGLFQVCARDVVASRFRYGFSLKLPPSSWNVPQFCLDGLLSQGQFRPHSVFQAIFPYRKRLKEDLARPFPFFSNPGPTYALFDFLFPFY